MLKISILRRLYPFVREHERLERAAIQRMGAILGSRYVGRFSRNGSLLRYAQKNAFSTMFLALYAALGMDEDKRRFYGTITHCVRGMVTGTDNLLDDEYKEMIPFRFHAKARKFKSVMHVMLFDRLLCSTLLAAAEAGLIQWSAVEEIERALLRHLAPIGAQEAEEESGVDQVMEPSEVLKRVLVHRGGDLLRLAFVAPRIVEGSDGPLGLADKGVFHVGMALQIVDDLTDVFEDIEARRHNFAVSSIFHGQERGERERLLAVMGGATPRAGVDELFPKATAQVVELAMEEALYGFRLLEEAGFWLDQEGALSLVRSLFHLRGVGHLLRFVPRTPPRLINVHHFPALPDELAGEGINP